MDTAKLTEGFAHLELLRFAKHCKELAGDREMLRLRDFHPTDVLWILGSLYVIEVLSDEADYRFKIFGSMMTAIYGMDFTGWRLSELPDHVLHREMRAYLHAIYDATVARRAPLLLRGKLRWNNTDIDTERLMIPLAEDDGHLSTILVAVHSNIPVGLPAAFRETGAPGLMPRELSDQQLVEIFGDSTS